MNSCMTKEDKVFNLMLGQLYKATKTHYESNRRLGTECIYCQKRHKKPNFPSCKQCGKPNLLIKFGFVDSGVINRSYPSTPRR